MRRTVRSFRPVVPASRSGQSFWQIVLANRFGQSFWLAIMVGSFQMRETEASKREAQVAADRRGFHHALGPYDFASSPEADDR